MIHHIAWGLGSTQVGQEAEEERAEVVGPSLGPLFGLLQEGTGKTR